MKRGGYLVSNKKNEVQTVKEFLEKKFPGGLPEALKETLEAIPLHETIRADNLRKKLKISPNALTRRLLRLEEDYPEMISRKFVKGKQMYEVSFNRPTLEESKTLEERLFVNPKGVKAKNLYLGEMGFGTKAYDPDAMTGLAYFIKYNNHTDLTNVMMLGALFPRIPEYYSVSGSEDMRFQAKDPTKKSEDSSELGEVIEYFAQKMKIDPKDAEYFKEHVEGKIKTRQDAANAVKLELGKLTAILSEKTVWHYQHGEEDRKNIQVTKEILIADAEEKKREALRKESGQYKAEKKRLEQELKETSKNAESANQKKTFMAYISKRLEDTKEKSGEELRAYMEGLMKSQLPQFEISRTDKSELTDLITSPDITKERILEEAKKLKDLASKLNESEKQLKNQIKEQEHKVAAMKKLDAALGFNRGTKRYKVEADEEEALFRLAKKDYNNFLYGACPKKEIVEQERFHVHSSAFNELTDPLSNDKAKRAPIVGDDDEYARIHDENGTFYLLAHNPNMLNSNTATKKDLKMMKDEVKRLVKMYDVLGAPIPDITLSSHGRGGFRFQYQMKFRETIMHGQNRLIPEVVLHIKLPTLQSVPKLESLRRRGLRNVHTKRYNNGCFASAAVVHTRFENGRDYIDLIDEHTLRQFAEVGRQIDLKKSKLREAKKEENEALIATLKTEINDLEKIIVQDDLVKIELDGDSHLGSANEPGRRSNYEVVDATQRYQKEYGLPDVTIISEAIHAEIPGVCATNQQYLGLTPQRFEKLLEDISSSKLSDEEKTRRIKRVAKEQVHATPITHLDVTLREWKARCMPYLLQILDKGGRVILVSGNHYNKAGSGRDEAEALANAIPLQYENQVEVFHARGDTIGCGETILPGGKTLYATHKLKDGPDEFVNALEQILRQGITADFVAHFDRHHGGGAYADNTAYAMAPGRQTWNKYVDQISKLSSPAGIVNVYLPKNKNIKFVRWEWALGNCLERYFMEPIDREQSLLERKPFIPEEPETIYEKPKTKK